MLIIRAYFPEDVLLYAIGTIRNGWVEDLEATRPNLYGFVCLFGLRQQHQLRELFKDVKMRVL